VYSVAASKHRQRICHPQQNRKAGSADTKKLSRRVANKKARQARKINRPSDDCRSATPRRPIYKPLQDQQTATSWRSSMPTSTSRPKLDGCISSRPIAKISQRRTRRIYSMLTRARNSFRDEISRGGSPCDRFSTTSNPARTPTFLVCSPTIADRHRKNPARSRNPHLWRASRPPSKLIRVATGVYPQTTAVPAHPENHATPEQDVQELYRNLAVSPTRSSPHNTTWDRIVPK